MRLIAFISVLIIGLSLTTIGSIRILGSHNDPCFGFFPTGYDRNEDGVIGGLEDFLPLLACWRATPIPEPAEESPTPRPTATIVVGLINQPYLRIVDDFCDEDLEVHFDWYGPDASSYTGRVDGTPIGQAIVSADQLDVLPPVYILTSEYAPVVEAEAAGIVVTFDSSAYGGC